MFNILDTVLTAVDAVDQVKYTADNIHDEITDYPAFVIEDDVSVDLEKLSVNGQIYNARVQFESWSHFPHDWDKATINTEITNIIKAVAGITGVDYIKVIRGRRTFWQIGSYKTRSVLLTFELLSRKSWV